MNSKTKWITETGVMTALLIILQAVTKPFGQIVTGSCVNFVLASATLACGLSSGLTVALLSPFFAFMLGIGPAFLPVVPGVSAGNAVLVLVLWALLGKTGSKAGIAGEASAVLAASVCKFLVLLGLIVKVILPALGLNEKQTAVLSASFSWPQLVTALIGTTLAVILRARLAKAIAGK